MTKIHTRVAASCNRRYLRRGFSVSFLCALFFFLSAPPLFAVPGDANGDGTVDIEDARTIARFLVHQIPAIPNPTDADVNQDGKIDMEDAFIIAKRVTGSTRILVVAPRYGTPDALQVGETIRIEVFEKFFPFKITGGTARIRSQSTGYDSGDQPLTFEQTGRSLYYHWNTAGLLPASDYNVEVTLNETAQTASVAAKSTVKPAEVLLPLTGAIVLNPRFFEPPLLATAVDASCPTPGIPLVFRRVSPHDSGHYPYLGPLGRGWVHNYDISLEAYTDGRVAFHGPEGFNRFFQSNADGTYTASPGDHGVLTRDPNGTFQLKEKSGLICRFRSDLRFDFMQDLNGNRITGIYDSNNRLVEIRHSCGKSFFLEYGPSGKITKLTDHAGRVTTYEYWLRLMIVGPVLVGPGPDQVLTRVTDPAGGVTEYTYSLWQSDVLNYRLLSIAFPDGTHTHFEYDSSARLVRQTGTWGANPVSYLYDPDGATHIVEATGGSTTIYVNDLGQPVSITGPDSQQSQMAYDNSANLTTATDPLTHVTRFAYDGFGNVVGITNPLNQTVQFGYDLRFNKPAWISDSLGDTTSFTYDSHGNATLVSYPDGSADNRAYDVAGNLVSFTDPLTNVTRYSYNAQGQATAITNALGNATGLSYDAAGELASVTDAKAHVVAMNRDALGRLTSRTYPDGSHEDYEYDATSKVTAFTNRRGERITFAYDVTGRLEWKNYPSGKQLHFQYDPRGLLSRVDTVAGGTTNLDCYFEYDLSQRVTKSKVSGTALGQTYDVSYAYDAAGNRRTMVYPDGYTLNYEYDAANRLTRIADATNATIAAYQYDTAGRRTKRTLGNGTYTTYVYDNLDRLTALTNSAPDGTVQSRFAYTYNAASMRTSMTTLEGVHNYTYDNTYQLTGVQYPDGQNVQYAFDPAGNRANVNDNGAITNYTVNALNQYTQAGAETFAYDGNGNLTTRALGGSTTSYGWDEDDRLISVNRGGVSITYRYDYQGRLVAKTIGGLKTQFVWNGLEVIAEVNSVGDIVRRRVYGAAMDEVALIVETTTNQWCQSDPLESVVAKSDDRGSFIRFLSYSVYGDSKTGLPQGDGDVFAGMLWHSESGLYYARTRWYSPDIGRFLSTDSVERDAGRLLYAYVDNDPVNFVDPEGLAKRVAGSWWTQIETLGPATVKEIEKTRTEAIIHLWSDPTIPKPLGYTGAVIMSLYDLQTPLTLLGAYQAFATYKGAIAIGSAWGKWMGGAYVSGKAAFFREGAKAILDWLMKSLPTDAILEALKNWLGGGVCPTFIQTPTGLPYHSELRPVGLADSDALCARISVPPSNSLLRSDIPIFGVAMGDGFLTYTVDCGKGYNPPEWHLLCRATNTVATCDISAKEAGLLQGDLDVRGNLATWNTGLKNWSHLPWHPPEDPTDLNGVYTIRLVVEGKDGKTVEDRVTCEVGRVIAQCLPGIAISPDKRVVMRFPEQALTHPFRIYTILPLSEVGEESPAPPAGCEFIGPVYRIREPGDKFIKDVALEFAPTAKESSKREPRHIGLCRYDEQTKAWVWLETIYRKDSGKTFSTVLTELPTPKAIYALAFDPKNDRSSETKPVTVSNKPLEPLRAGVLVDQTFEQDLGAFKPRDRFVGAVLSRDNKATPDGSYCLKLTEENHGGNFSCTVLDRPFDVQEYPTMTFDYRIALGVKTDFLLKVNSRWYNLRFTGDPVDYRNRDVNIANLGAIEGVLADDKWHTASVDLRYLLRQQTRHTRVEEIVLADWDVGGYMKLEFGRNPRGATFYLDNFKITGPGSMVKNSPVLLVDDFDAAATANVLSGPSGAYCNPGTRNFEVSLVGALPGSAKLDPPTADGNRALRLTFNMTQPDSYGGYWISLKDHDLSSYNSLRFRLKTESPVPGMHVGIRNVAGVEGKTMLAPYASEPDKNGWRDVQVPLRGLYGLTDFTTPDVLFFSVGHGCQSGKGNVLIDDLRFDQAPYSRVADFDSPFEWNLLGGGYATYQNGAATVSASSMSDATAGPRSSNIVCRISYGGSIGRDYGKQGGFSYCSWQCALSGTDGRQFKDLTLRIRGDKGGEAPNFYLSDGSRRACLRAKEVDPITTEWREIRLPLSHFGDNGVDLSHLDLLQIVFEWAEQSGTIYIDDIRLR